MPLYQRPNPLSFIRIDHHKKALLVLSLVITSFTIAQNVSAQISEEDYTDEIMGVNDGSEKKIFHLSLFADYSSLWVARFNIGVCSLINPKHGLSINYAQDFGFSSFIELLFLENNMDGGFENSGFNRIEFAYSYVFKVFDSFNPFGDFFGHCSYQNQSSEYRTNRLAQTLSFVKLGSVELIEKLRYNVFSLGTGLTTSNRIFLDSRLNLGLHHQFDYYSRTSNSLKLTAKTAFLTLSKAAAYFRLLNLNPNYS